MDRQVMFQNIMDTLTVYSQEPEYKNKEIKFKYAHILLDTFEDYLEFMLEDQIELELEDD